MLVVLNFTPISRKEYRLGVPERGKWKEVFNSDAEIMVEAMKATGATRCRGHRV